MRYIEGIIATGHMDKQHHVLMPEALQDLAEQINQVYVPMWVEHDVAHPPIGRWISAEVVKLEDGVLGVKANGEVWEVTDTAHGIPTDGRKMVVHETEFPTFEVGFDLSFEDQDGRRIIAELRDLGAAKSQIELRKSAQVISQLTIAVGIIAGAIATGFLTKLGEDIYDGLKVRLKRLRKEKGPEGADRATRILFAFTVEVEGKRVQAEVVLDNATDESIEKFFSEGLEKLDTFVAKALELEPRTSRVTARQTEEDLLPLFFVRDDCVPRLVQRVNAADQALRDDEQG